VPRAEVKARKDTVYLGNSRRPERGVERRYAPTEAAVVIGKIACAFPRRNTTRKEERVTLKCMMMKRIGVLVSAAVAACVLLPVCPVDALAQGFVTGSANTDGFSIVGWLRDIGNGLGRGDFTIIVHRDSVDGTTVGEPGAGNDSVDVNLASGTGITIPGSRLVDGNFIVSP
jgi:hypothetical protein